MKLQTFERHLDVEAILCVEYDSIKSQNIQINKLEKEGDM
jgi:hypothetical protein